MLTVPRRSRWIGGEARLHRLGRDHRSRRQDRRTLRIPRSSAIMQHRGDAASVAGEILRLARSLGLTREQAPKRAEPALVMLPAPGGTPIDGLANLPHAWRANSTSIVLGMQTVIVPRDAAEGNQPACNALAIRDQILIVEGEKPIAAQYILPMRHEFRVLLMI